MKVRFIIKDLDHINDKYITVEDSFVSILPNVGEFVNLSKLHVLLADTKDIKIDYIVNVLGKEPRLDVFLSNNWEGFNNSNIPHVLDITEADLR